MGLKKTRKTKKAKETKEAKKIGYTLQHAMKGKNIALPSIAVWKNQYKRNYNIQITLPEFTSICPKTGLPDFGIITIDYVPDKYCAELKSLKHYLLSYRNVGIFMENTVNRILDDIVKCVKPKKVIVIGEFTPRGGISSTIEATYAAKK
ncbi:MAG TPA: preQ(1) synthase [Elusimicrobiales bacterium]|nr:preQ(1) synthase [Elusimicrobiales bacterium]